MIVDLKTKLLCNPLITRDINHLKTFNKMKLFITSLSIIVSLNCFGWGQTGHRVVGQIAQNHLSSMAQKAIQEIMGRESLAYASTWMDEIKSDNHYDHTHDWHWVTIPDGGNYVEADKNPDGDAVEAINRMVEILKDETADNGKKVEALRFLVHLVGDIHQPLHVGNGTDKGGNDVKVKWFGSSSNLHRVWDSGMLESRDWSYSELVTQLDCSCEDSILAYQSTLNPEDWAAEAMSYRSQVYKTGDVERMGYQYTYQNWDLLELQLFKAGIRLAGLLNSIYE